MEFTINRQIITGSLTHKHFCFQSWDLFCCFFHSKACLPSIGFCGRSRWPPRVDPTPPFGDLRRTLFGVRSHSLYAQIWDVLRNKSLLIFCPFRLGFSQNFCMDLRRIFENPKHLFLSSWLTPSHSALSPTKLWLAYLGFDCVHFSVLFQRFTSIFQKPKVKSDSSETFKTRVDARV